MRLEKHVANLICSLASQFGRIQNISCLLRITISNLIWFSSWKSFSSSKNSWNYVRIAISSILSFFGFQFHIQFSDFFLFSKSNIIKESVKADLVLNSKEQRKNKMSTSKYYTLLCTTIDRYATQLTYFLKKLD